MKNGTVVKLPILIEHTYLAKIVKLAHFFILYTNRINKNWVDSDLIQNLFYLLDTQTAYNPLPPQKFLFPRPFCPKQ